MRPCPAPAVSGRSKGRGRRGDSDSDRRLELLQRPGPKPEHGPVGRGMISAPDRSSAWMTRTSQGLLPGPARVCGALVWLQALQRVMMVVRCPKVAAGLGLERRSRSCGALISPLRKRDKTGHHRGEACVGRKVVADYRW